MSDFLARNVLPAGKQLNLERAIVSAYSGETLEMALMSPHCLLASHSIAAYSRMRNHSSTLDTYAGKIPKMRNNETCRKFGHVLLRDAENGTIIDPTALQVVGRAGFTANDAPKFQPLTPNNISRAGRGRIFEFTEDQIPNFVDFIAESVLKARARALKIRDKLSWSYQNHSQDFLDIDECAVRERLLDMWNMDNYHPDPIEDRNDDFKDAVNYFVEHMKVD